jgi:hypothetical protein
VSHYEDLHYRVKDTNSAENPSEIFTHNRIYGAGLPTSLLPGIGRCYGAGLPTSLLPGIGRCYGAGLPTSLLPRHRTPPIYCFASDE